MPAGRKGGREGGVGGGDGEEVPEEIREGELEEKNGMRKRKGGMMIVERCQ